LLTQGDVRWLRKEAPMNVEKLMSTDVKSCMPDHNLACAARIMWEGDCGCVPVVDGGGRVVGMITDRDICMATYLNGRLPHELRISDFMSQSVLCCHPRDRITDATAAMRRAQVRRLPVTDSEDVLVGILSLTDVAINADHPQPAFGGGSTPDDVGKTLGAVGRPRTGIPVELHE
jgi:CBS domain-containing protein